MHELVLKECRHLESSSIKSRVLSACVRRVHGVEVDFCKVAMEVASNDFPAGVETVTIDPVLKLTTVQFVLRPNIQQLLGLFTAETGISLNKLGFAVGIAQDVSVSRCSVRSSTC